VLSWAADPIADGGLHVVTEGTLADGTPIGNVLSSIRLEEFLCTVAMVWDCEVPSLVQISKRPRIQHDIVLVSDPVVYGTSTTPRIQLFVMHRDAYRGRHQPTCKTGALGGKLFG
jgi:hypothetical protein